MRKCAHANGCEQYGVGIRDAKEVDFEVTRRAIGKHPGDNAPLLELLAVCVVGQTSASASVHVVERGCGGWISTSEINTQEGATRTHAVRVFVRLLRFLLDSIWR